MARVIPAIGQIFGQDLCDIFGLDKDLVNHISLEVELDHIVMVTTTRYVTEEETDKLTALLKEYYLIEKREQL
jgi:hypothetical protein